MKSYGSSGMVNSFGTDSLVNNCYYYFSATSKMFNSVDDVIARQINFSDDFQIV